MGKDNVLFVTLLGMGVVFIGLICLIILTKLSSKIINGKKKAEAADGNTIGEAPGPNVQAPIPNRQQFVAAISAAIAMYMGSDISGLRIHSIKKI